MRLYKTRLQTVEVHPLRTRPGAEQRFLVERADGKHEVLSQSELNARYEPVVDLRV